ncbi:MAG: YggS family pyridoxal phosphate-dependent enzyme [Dehalococcoidia bacterium]
MSIAQTYRSIRDEVPSSVTIVLAGKTRTPEEILEAIDAGATDIGQNYVQEAVAVYEALGEKAKSVRWHMLGTLQKNKINQALPVFDVIQTVESVEKAIDIDKRARSIGKRQPVYVEINIGSEVTKAGLEPRYEMVENAVREIAGLENISVEGLMTMGPRVGDPEDNRSHFRKTKEIFDRIRDLQLPNVNMQTLSMGMSNSYRVAIEEGANMVRLGTVVFGERDY